MQQVTMVYCSMEGYGALQAQDPVAADLALVQVDVNTMPCCLYADALRGGWHLQHSVFCVEG